jgi:hypothetical protein
MFNEHCNLFNGKLDVVVHEWPFNSNIGLENLSFQIVGIFNMMHVCCVDMTFYVFVIHVIFQANHQPCAKTMF